MESSSLLTRTMEFDWRERELFGDVRILDAGRLVHCLPLDRREVAKYVQSVFSTLSQGLEDDILESSLGRWADSAATYCPGRPSQMVFKSMTKHRDRVEKRSVNKL